MQEKSITINTDQVSGESSVKTDRNRMTVDDVVVLSFVQVLPYRCAVINNGNKNKYRKESKNAD